MKIVYILVFLFLSASTWAQELRPVNRTFALTGINIVKSPGQIINNGTIIIKDGLIVEVGTNIKIPAQAQILKMDTLYAYAAFIDGYSSAGVKMPKEDDSRSQVRNASDPTEDEAGIQPHRMVKDFLEPGQKSIDDLRRAGFGTAQVVPDGMMLPGSGAVILLAGDQPDAMILKSPSVLYGQLKGARRIYPATLIGVMAKFEDLYRQAVLNKDYLAEYQKSPAGLDRPVSSRVHEAFYPVISGQIPMLFNAPEVLDVQRIISMKKDYGFRLTLGGVKQAWDLVPQIKSHVDFVWFSLDLPDDKDLEKESEAKAGSEKALLEERKQDFIKKHYQQSTLFVQNGVQFGFGSNGAKSGDILKNIRKLVENGLTQDQALAALTTHPARQLGLSELVGTLDKGKIANIAIFDKEVFEEDAAVKFMFVDGHLFDYSAKPKGKKADADKIAAVTGTWNYTTDSPQGSSGGELILREEGGYLTGSISNSMSDQATSINDVVLEGKSLSFSFDFDAGGQKFTITVAVTLDGETFEGTLTAGSFGSFPMKGTKQPE